MFFASLFSVMIEFKNERVFMNFLLSIRIIPVGGYTYNSLYEARNLHVSLLDIICFKMQTVFRERSFEATQYNGTLLLLLLPKNCTRQFCVLTSFGLKFFYFTVVSDYNEVSLSLNSILYWRYGGVWV